MAAELLLPQIWASYALHTVPTTAHSLNVQMRNLSDVTVAQGILCCRLTMSVSDKFLQSNIDQTLWCCESWQAAQCSEWTAGRTNTIPEVSARNIRPAAA